MTTRKPLSSMSDVELAEERERLRRIMVEEAYPDVGGNTINRDINRPGRSHVDLLYRNPGVTIFYIFAIGLLTMVVGLAITFYFIPLN